jgi:hypothetical protein
LQPIALIAARPSCVPGLTIVSKFTKTMVAKTTLLTNLWSYQ